VQGIEYSHTADTEADALGFIAAVKRRGTRDVNAAPSLASYAPGWITYREQHKQIETGDTERSLYRSIIGEWDHADTPLRAVRRRHVAEYIAQLARQGDHAHETIKHRLRFIRGMFTAAADEGKVGTNPAEGVKVPRMRKGERADTWTYLEPHEIDAVLALEYPKISTLQQRSIFATAIYTGLRRSELWHLTWGNVDLAAGVLKVRAPLKSVKAKRDVPLLPPALNALRAWHAETQATRGRRRALYVWPNSRHGLRASNDAGWSDQKSWRVRQGERHKHVRPGAKTNAGIARHVRFHDLRHTCASHLVMGTWGIELGLYEVAQWMGHSSIAVTQRYAHLAPDGLQGKVTRMLRRTESE
jgi:integrase